MPTISLAHPDDEVGAYIRDVCIATRETWVAVIDAVDGPRVVALLVLGDASIDQLYVHPDQQSQGIGSQMLALAKARRPDGFELYAFQVNVVARRFYERRGLVLVDLDDGGRNEEGEPDVRYRWEPPSP